ncbi:E3 ubiquitin-protein ligase TRIM39-like [Anomaloglossus baeobatrachus]|uniref:E3 ubiquitin-protein ligase TRIM39-like n=1 Tax=Anomaloglossus baeobatrachus TaxID=238106 RepID=UPI003F4F68C7
MAAVDLRDELQCSIDQEVYKDPVTLPCGHNFCRDCITKTFDHQHEDDYRCPECLQRFKKRPELIRNHKLRNMAEACPQPDQEQTGIFCTFCDFSVPAEKSCLQCETSMCATHVTRHNKTVLGHTLLPPSTDLNNRKCPVHQKILEYYCKEDKTCICVFCRLDGNYERHQVEPLDEATEHKKENLRNILKVLTSREEEMTKKIQSLQEEKKKIHEKATLVSEKVIEHFQYVKRQLAILEERVLSEISRQKEDILLSLSGIIEGLQRKKDELSEKMGHIEELCRVDEPVTLMQVSIDDFSHVKDTDDVTELEDRRTPYVDEIQEGINLKSLLEYLSSVITSVKKGIFTFVPTAITLDTKSAGQNLHISGDFCTEIFSNQDEPESPDRFEYPIVFSIEQFSFGKHYWDLETSESGCWRVGVSYGSLPRRGYQSLIGDNDKSWCLRRFGRTNWARHNSKDIPIAHSTSCERLRVCLDYDEGRLSFYDLSDPIKHLHTFIASFTEPLHAAIALWGYPCEYRWVKVMRH